MTNVWAHHDFRQYLMITPLYFRHVVFSPVAHFATPKIAEQRQLLLADATSFLRLMEADAQCGKLDIDWADRLSNIESQIRETGTYLHTAEELEFGARLAWKNSNRCIGRHMWRSLHVIDHRDTRDLDGVVSSMGDHLERAWNGGRIQSVITVFAPRHPEHPERPDAVRFANHQLTRYAGFEHHSGHPLGDPASLDLTRDLMAQGWTPKEKTRFTPLPWSIWLNDQRQPPIDAYAEHPDWLHEVEMTHPDNAAFADLGLKWYAVPAISEMALVIGGIVYPCAPFNGWYMGTEIGARNFGDTGRYDMLPEVARLLGLDTSSERQLWRDRALVELNRAVLHSFDLAGVQIGDHHELSRQFDRFCKAEERNQRDVTGDWSWLAPPISASATPQFHKRFDERVIPHTNYFYQSPVEVDVEAQKSGRSNPGMPHPDPYHLGHAHATPRCPYGFDRK